jgi:hypothetical protein
MSIIVSNAIMLPLFSTWFIPVAIRNPRTGHFKGLWNIDFVVAVVALILFESYVTLSAFGPEPWSFVQIAICVAMAIALGFVFVFLTQKELFGNKFDMKIKRE